MTFVNATALFDAGAKADGNTDDTGAIQAALLSAQAAGGGKVIVPFGRETVIAGQVNIPPNCGIGSMMPGPFDPSQVSLAAPTILVPNAQVSPFSFTGRNSFIEDILVHYPNQAAPTASTPVSYPATVTTASGSAGCKMRRATLTNAYQGFSLLGGRHLIEDIWAGCFSNVFTVDDSLDVIWVRDIQANPFWNTVAGLGYPQTIDTWVAANKVVGDIYRADGLRLRDIFGFVGNIGLRMQDSSYQGLTTLPSYGEGSNIRFDTFSTGIICKSTQGPGWQITNYSANCSTTNIQMASGGGTAPKLRIAGGSFWGSNKGVQNTAGGLHVAGVEGFNPQGNQGAPGMPASGTALGNPFASTMCVYISAGVATVSAVGIGPGQPATGITIASGAVAGPFILAPNEGIKLTYSGGTPTWTWFGI